MCSQMPLSLASAALDIIIIAFSLQVWNFEHLLCGCCPMSVKASAPGLEWEPGPVAAPEWKLKLELVLLGPEPCSWPGAVLLPEQELSWSHCRCQLETSQSDMWHHWGAPIVCLSAGMTKFLRKSYNLLHVLQEEFPSRGLQKKKSKKTCLCNRHLGICLMGGSENGLKGYSRKN